MDTILSISEVRARLPQMVDRLKTHRREHIVITRGGKPGAVLLSPEELETLEVLADKRLMLSLLKAEGDVKAGHLAKHDEIFK